MISMTQGDSLLRSQEAFAHAVPDRDSSTKNEENKNKMTELCRGQL